MYGRHTAAHTWQNDWHELLKSAGYTLGKGNAALFYNPTNHGRGGTHGDDFYVLGTRQAVDEMGETLRSKYNLRESYRLGFRDHCVREARV